MGGGDRNETKRANETKDFNNTNRFAIAQLLPSFPLLLLFDDTSSSSSAAAASWGILMNHCHSLRAQPLNGGGVALIDRLLAVVVSFTKFTFDGALLLVVVAVAAVTLFLFTHFPLAST